MDLREVEHKAAQAALVQQSEKALIVGLQTEKKHLEKSLKENQALKENYREKNLTL